MMDYAIAKRKLFEKAKVGIFNADSPWSQSMGRGLTFGIQKGMFALKTSSAPPKELNLMSMGAALPAFDWTIQCL